MTCECRVCTYGQKVFENLEKITDPVVKAFMLDMYEGYCQEQNDVSMYKAILEGTWPSSIGWLTNGLEKAKAFNLTREFPE